jgi:psiF repeat
LVSLERGDLETPILAQRRPVTTGDPSPCKNIVTGKTPPALLHSSEVQHRSATLWPSSTRGDFMMTTSSRVALAAFASLFLVSAAFAQTPATPAPAAKTEAAPAAEKKAPVMHSAASIECSKEADTKGLKGKERKKFRSECKRAAKDAAKPK